MSDPTVSKTCFECHQTKPAAEFYRNTGHRDGFSSRCRSCTLIDAARRWRLAHPETPYTPPTEKICGTCGETKPMEQFHRRQGARDGHQSRCRECTIRLTIEYHRQNPGDHARRAKEWARKHPDKRADLHLRWRLGLEPGTYARMFAEQDGRCAICGTDKAGGNGKRLSVDHNAYTGAIRGLLCTSCNNGIGRFAHDPDRLTSAAAYLRLHLLRERSC